MRVRKLCGQVKRGVERLLGRGIGTGRDAVRERGRVCWTGAGGAALPQLDQRRRLLNRIILGPTSIRLLCLVHHLWCELISRSYLEERVGLGNQDPFPRHYSATFHPLPHPTCRTGTPGSFTSKTLTQPYRPSLSSAACSPTRHRNWIYRKIKAVPTCKLGQAAHE